MRSAATYILLSAAILVPLDVSAGGEPLRGRVASIFSRINVLGRRTPEGETRRFLNKLSGTLLLLGPGQHMMRLQLPTDFRVLETPVTRRGTYRLGTGMRPQVEGTEHVFRLLPGHYRVLDKEGTPVSAFEVGRFRFGMAVPFGVRPYSLPDFSPAK